MSKLTYLFVWKWTKTTLAPGRITYRETCQNICSGTLTEQNNLFDTRHQFTFKREKEKNGMNFFFVYTNKRMNKYNFESINQFNFIKRSNKCLRASTDKKSTKKQENFSVHFIAYFFEHLVKICCSWQSDNGFVFVFASPLANMIRQWPWGHRVLWVKYIQKIAHENGGQICSLLLLVPIHFCDKSPRDFKVWQNVTRQK